MLLDYIHIKDFRNIVEAKIQFGKQLNVFYGENGSGKSSVLESIYMLTTGKSFRTRQITKIIKEKENKLTLFGKLEQAGNKATLGLERSVRGHVIRINGETVTRFSALASCLPVLVITQDSHKLLEAGPQWRRQFIDWGLFHVEHNFLSIWLNYRKLLKNRNVALANGAKQAEIDAWNEGLASYGEAFTAQRQAYITGILPLFQDFTDILLGNRACNLEYRRGWPASSNLLDTLNSQYQRDIRRGRTSYGPHRGDLVVKINGYEAKDHVSRGQQKLLVNALYFAQISYLKKNSNKNTLILLDDLGAELDIGHARKLINLVATRFSQVCITTANLDSLPLDKNNKVKLFHVKHGDIKSVD